MPVNRIPTPVPCVHVVDVTFHLSFAGKFKLGIESSNGVEGSDESGMMAVWDKMEAKEGVHPLGR